MFIDESEIYVKAGNGGDGAVSFRREKFIPLGGPDGGDGGRGGDIQFETDQNLHGLALYNAKRDFRAENGHSGMGSNKSGKSGKDLVLRVPPGTQIYQKDTLLIDLVQNNQNTTLYKGGRGGWGNQHFATSIKQAPMWSKKGERGESAKIRLILKTIADVGLIGLPNAGKSTLLSVVSAAKPKIANYPFTTLEPNMGTYIGDDIRIVFADIPGLIEGAWKGVGLGDKFLRHIERTRLVVHLIDAGSDNIVRDYKTIRTELKKYSEDLSNKGEIVVISKIDTIDSSDLKAKTKALAKLNSNIIPISASTNEGVTALIHTIAKSLATANKS